MSDYLPAIPPVAFGPQLVGVPLWEAVIVLGLAGAIIAMALWGHPRSRGAETSASDEAQIAIVDELHVVDKNLTSHANGVLTLSTLAAGAFGTVIRTNGGLGQPLVFATAIALLTCFAITAVGLALVGGATAAAAMPTTELRACVEHNLRRVHRRTQSVRAATWCLFPSVVLVVVCIAEVRRR